MFERLVGWARIATGSVAHQERRSPTRSLDDLSANLHAPLSDFESSALRWAFDAMLTEFTAIREEILKVKEQMERTYSYLLALIGAILASQFITGAGVKLEQHPTLYLVGALLSLWFPVNNIVMAVDMNALGGYLREILLPKLNAVVLAAARSGIHKSADLNTLIGWSDEAGRILSPEMRAVVKTPMSWEEFLPMVRLGRWSQRAALAPIYLMRTAILYAPMALLVGLFVASVKQISPFQTLLIALSAAVLVSSGVATATVGGMVTFALKRGPFQRR